MKEYLEFSKNGSNKFWELELKGSKVIARFGRIGTTGQKRVSEFHSSAVARAAYFKKVDGKKKKGYKKKVDAEKGTLSRRRSVEVTYKDGTKEKLIIDDTKMEDLIL